MSYKTRFIPATCAKNVSAALKAAGWNVSAEALKRDGYLINHIDDGELEDGDGHIIDIITGQETGK